jgi:Sulfotransferase domain
MFPHSAIGSKQKTLESRPMPKNEPVRIAMWSGPRNISTAMMRSWGNRPDSAVCDEPFYAYFLRATGPQHPGRDEVIAHGETDWRRVTDQLTGAIPGGKRILYQKPHFQTARASRSLPALGRGARVRRNSGGRKHHRRNQTDARR